MSAKDHENKAAGMSARVSVITCSDTRTVDSDTSGNHIVTQIQNAQHHLLSYQIIRDDPALIVDCVYQQVQQGADVILVNGGTGISSRDNSFEALGQIIESHIPGFGELFRMLSYEEIGAAAFLSRAQAGRIQRSVVFSMPGSTPAVRLAMEKLILPQIAHLIAELRK